MNSLREYLNKLKQARDALRNAPDCTCRFHVANTIKFLIPCICGNSEKKEILEKQFWDLIDEL